MAWARLSTTHRLRLQCHEYPHLPSYDAAFAGSRRRNLLTLPTGERFWLIFGTRTFREISPAIRQYQVIQTALDRLEVRLVTDVALSADIERQLRDLVVRTVGYPFGVNLVYPAEIRMVAGKHEEFKSEI
jgi:phenylacetate-CoA ligase